MGVSGLRTPPFLNEACSLQPGDVLQCALCVPYPTCPCAVPRPSVLCVPGFVLQTRMTIPYSWWQANSWTRLSATVLFALPGDEAVVVPVHRHCNVRLNSGPDGAQAAFTVWQIAGLTRGAEPKQRPQSREHLDLSPLDRYVVHISGWTHHSIIHYSVWFYWDSNPGFVFRLTADSTSTDHVITVPALTVEATAHLLVRATDEWEAPHNDCAACHRPVALRPISTASFQAYLDGMLSAPWDSVTPVFEVLALVGDFEAAGKQAGRLQAAFLHKVREVCPCRLFVCLRAMACTPPPLPVLPGCPFVCPLWPLCGDACSCPRGPNGVACVSPVWRVRPLCGVPLVRS